MTYETILYNVTDDIATLTLNRPKMMNSLNVKMRQEILNAIKTAQSEARVLIITGAGKAFCAGADLVEATENPDMDYKSILQDEYEPVLREIYDCVIPTISAVNGPAAGAGANLALAADIVIATESAFFLQAFARIGLVPDAGGSYWLPRQMGIAKAMGAALLAEPISAKDADDWGMIWESTPDEEFWSTVNRRALALAGGPTKSLQLIKTLMRQSLQNSLNDQLTMEAELQSVAGSTDDHKEGVNAFLEKRKPNYSGK